MKKLDKIPKKHLRVYDPIFKQEIHIFLNTPAEDYTRWQKRMGIKEPEDVSNTFLGWVTTFESDEAPPIYVVYIKDFQWTIKCQGTLIHELAHVVVRLWGTNNIPFNEDTQEFYAHTLANIYEDIARKLL